jgi:hypothetical protein
MPARTKDFRENRTDRDIQADPRRNQKTAGPNQGVSTAAHYPLARPVSSIAAEAAFFRL